MLCTETNDILKRLLGGVVCGLSHRAVLKTVRKQSENWAAAYYPHKFRGALLFVLGLSLAGCNRQPPQQAPPPPPVTIAKPIQKEVVEWDEFTGRTDAVQMVDIRPRVSGYIDNLTFKAGDLINQGDLLFVIDPRPYQAIYDQAVAQMRQAEANRQLNDANFQRASRLRANNVTSKEEYDTSLAQKNQADAALVSSQAQVSAAKLNLDFTQIKAPISGRISREQVTVGNLVQTDNTLLTNITSVDPIYAYFNVDERSVERYQELHKGRVDVEQSVPVYLKLENETGFPHQGIIDFTNNQFDSGTGTLQVRGVFPNKDGLLIPGAFVTVRVAGTAPYQGILITDRAVVSDQGRKFVLVVDANNVAQPRPVDLGPVFEGLRIVRKGLQGDENVIINGIVNARPGSKVTPQSGDMTQFTSNQLNLQTKAEATGAASPALGKSPPASPQAAPSQSAHH
jgi:membrane fusion protein, multidrug efflux system